MQIIKLILVALSATIFLTSCGSSDTPSSAPKEMLIYCGITMVNPIKELATNFEKKHNCKIIINQGGSEDLYQSLKFSKIGELYLPGSSFYRSKHLDEGLLGEYIYVGYNQASLIVQKGNPKSIAADIQVLADKRYATVIGNPESCSIGRQSKKILAKKGIFDDVMTHSVIVAADSRTMNKTIIDKSADVILNWGATAYFDENKEFMDRLSLPESVAPKKKLLINLLSFAREPELARAFMTYAGSIQGQTVFHKYGFLDQISEPAIIQQP